MKAQFSFILLFLIAISCDTIDTSIEGNKTDTLDYLNYYDSNLRIFPEEINGLEDYPCEKYRTMGFPKLVSIDIFKPVKYSDLISYSASYFLYGFEQEALKEVKDSSQILRLLYKPTFDNPILIRIEKNEKLELTYIKSNGQGGYNFGNIDTKFVKTLNDSVWKDLIHIPAEIFNNDTILASQMGADGSSWIFEVKLKDNYHVYFGANIPYSNNIKVKEYFFDLFKLVQLKIDTKYLY